MRGCTLARGSRSSQAHAFLERLRVAAHWRWLIIAILLVGLALRVTYLHVDQFHADEALYAGWALDILDGDLLLIDAPVDKPPLYLYTLASSMAVLGSSEVAARIPNLFASVLGIALVYRLGGRLYGRSTGTWAALFVALSPFDILFARTAFTDPMLVLWVLAALCVAVDGRRGGFRRWFWAGVLLGLAFATKQHAVVLFPLVVAAGLLRVIPLSPQGARPRLPVYRCLRPLLGALLGFAIPYGLVLLWDSARWPVRPGYWQQSAMSYGGLAWAPPGEWPERLVEWLSWARYLFASPVLNALLLVGVGAPLIWGWRRRGGWRHEDALWASFALLYLLLHTVLRLSIWDRYLLPLVPLLALLLARVVVQGGSWIAALRSRCASQGDAAPQPGQMRGFLRALCAGSPAVRVVYAGCAVVVCLAAIWAGGRGSVNGYPVGGEHWAYQGLDRVAAYLKENAPADAVLYHHWLRWHYTYYLHGTTFELRWWQSAEHLQREVLRTPDRVQYIVLPDWRTLEPDAEELVFVPVYETHRQDGSVSLRVYLVEPKGKGGT